MCISRHGQLWIKFHIIYENKRLLFSTSTINIFQEFAKMNFKSSQNCRRVKLAALEERGLESCNLRGC